jgi:hypothetical protein
MLPECCRDDAENALLRTWSGGTLIVRSVPRDCSAITYRMWQDTNNHLVGRVNL